MTKASLVVIGTELTRGIIQDKHTPLVAKELTGMGVHFSSSVMVPDDGTIRSVLSNLIKENDIVLVTGGLGPTKDDMTRTVIAEAAGKTLVQDKEAWDTLYKRIGERIHGANERQTYKPEGFTIIPNPFGTAPGFYGMAGETLIISMPGPPREMEPMFRTSVLPLIRDHLGLPEEARDEYSVFIISESKLEEMTAEADDTLDWGDRFQDYRISLYVSGKTKAERDEAIRKLREMAGEGRIVDGDQNALPMLTDLLKKDGKTIACAESCTGGLASSLLTSTPGSSAYMVGAVTSYATEVKEKVLGVPAELVAEHGVVSRECAGKMAEGVLDLMGSDYAFSITGVAGPDKQEDKDVGTVCFGIAGKGRESATAQVRFNSYGRESVRRRAAAAAFILMRAYILGEDVEKMASSWKFF